MTAYLTELLREPGVLAGAALLVLALLVVIALRIRKLAKSERPDEPLSNLAMLIGLGWSSEAVWVITKDMPTGVRIALFCVLEVFLTLSMIRARRHMREHDWPGRPGQTTWGIAALMGVVAVFAAASAGEAVLRLAIPLALAKLWWDGLVGGRKRPQGQVSSWRWTPRRLLLAVGAIEPGERDVETVHRQRLTQQMTNLEFERRHGSDKQREKAAAKLARLSLTSDDDIVSEVRRRVDRATWFEASTAATPRRTPRMVLDYDRPIGPDLPAAPEPVDKLSSAKPAAVAPRKRPPSSADRVVAAHKRTPKATDAELAARLGVSEKTVQRHRPAKAEEPKQINGSVPALAGVGASEKEV